MWTLTYTYHEVTGVEFVAAIASVSEKKLMSNCLGRDMCRRSKRVPDWCLRVFRGGGDEVRTQKVNLQTKCPFSLSIMMLIGN